MTPFLFLKIHGKTASSFSNEEYISRNAKPDNFIGKSLYFLNIFGRKWLEKKVLKRSDEIIVLSRFTLDNLCRAYKVLKQNVLIIPGGVDLKWFQPAKDKIKIRQRLNIPPQKIMLFTVRNLVPRMGLENLIIAIEKVIKTLPDIYLVLGGEGPLKGDLIALAKRLGVESHVRFMGFIPENELPSYYQMADLIADNYRIIKENPGKWAEISRRCRKFVEDHYSWDKNIDALENIFFNG